MDCGMKCVKYILFLFNLVFALCGLILLITGIVIQTVYKEYLDFLQGEQFFDAPLILIAVGCVIFIVAFFGCCGAIRESYKMTLCFAFLLAVIFILEIGTGIAAYKLRSRVNDVIEKNMESGMEHFNLTNYDGVTATWDAVQTELKCCGAQEYLDWKNTTFSQNTSVPDSCCLEETLNCGVGMLDLTKEDAKTKIHVNGCFSSFSAIIIKNVTTVGGVGIGIGFIQFIGLMFACCLARAINSNYEEV